MRLAISIVAVALTLVACNSDKGTSEKAGSQQPGKPALQTETGRTALQRMMIPAHLWAGDVQAISLESEPSEESNGLDGKSAFWRSVWGSETKRSAKNFSWSGSATGDANSRGITPGSEDSWSSANTSMQTFNIGFLKVDSDAALAAAKQKLTGKEKEAKTVRYALTFDPHQNQLLWRLTFGDGGQGKTLDVDATTGKYLRTER